MNWFQLQDHYRREMNRAIGLSPVLTESEVDPDEVARKKFVDSITVPSTTAKSTAPPRRTRPADRIKFVKQVRLTESYDRTDFVRSITQGY